MTTVPRVLGLHTSENPLADVPDGALATATNCWMRLPGVLEPRPGIGLDSASNVALGGTAKAMFGIYGAMATDFMSNANIHGVALVTYGTTLAVTEGTALTNISTALLSCAAWPYPRFARALANVYLAYASASTSDVGSIYRVENKTTVRLAGVPRAVEARVFASGSDLTGASGFLANNTQCAYRYLFGIKDTSGAIHLGAPSGRDVCTNTAGGSRNVIRRVYLPQGLTTSHFLQAYRTPNSAGAAVVPGTEFYQVYEYQLVVGDITAGYVDFTDIFPDALLAVPLYVNSNTGLGEEAAAERPPVNPADIAYWDDRLWCAGQSVNTDGALVTLLGTGAPSGLQDSDTVTVGGVVYTAKAAPGAAPEFQLYTAGSATDNVENTVRALAAAINTYASSNAQAYVISGQSQAGQLLVRRRTATDVSFSSSRATAWAPVGTAVSDAEDQRLLSYSSQEDVEAFPLLNRLYPGEQGDLLQRIIPLGDKLFLFLRDGGVWTVSGTYPYRVEPLDASLSLLGRRMACVHNGKIYAFTTKGVVTISDAGVENISDPVFRDLERRAKDIYASAQWFQGLALSVAGDNRVEFWVPATDSNTALTQAFVYNSKLREWFYWTHTRGILSAIAYPFGPSTASTAYDDITRNEVRALYGDGVNSALMEEHNFARTYGSATQFLEGRFDDEKSETIASGGGTTVLTSGTLTLEVGDVLEQAVGGMYHRAVVTEVVSATEVTVDTTVAWNAASCTVYKGYPVTAEFSQVSSGAPGTRKRYREATLHFRRCDIRNDADFTVVSDVGSVAKTESFKAPGWGLVAWGDVPWGQPTPMLRNIRREVSRNVGDCNFLRPGLYVREALADWELLGVTVEGEPISERNSR